MVVYHQEKSYHCSTLKLLAMTEKTIHEGRNVKRIREILGIKQDALAMDLGLSQQAISALEQKEKIDENILADVAKILKVPVDAIRNMTEDAAANFFNTFTDNSTGAFYNYNCNFNPIDKVVDLYERMIKEKDEKIALLERMLEKR
jgi:transcriptional regulator with XRE-family HTH domain